MIEVIWRIICGLFLISVLIYGLSILYLKVSRMQPSAGRAIRVISSVFLGPRKTITVVDVAGEYLVLGLSGDSITYLTKIESEDAKRLIEKDAGTGNIPGLKRLFGDSGLKDNAGGKADA